MVANETLRGSVGVTAEALGQVIYEMGIDDLDLPDAQKLAAHILARLAPAADEAAEALSGPADLNVLILSWAIDEHSQAMRDEPVHDEGTCSDDCAGDIRARYRRAYLAAHPAPEEKP